MGYEGEREELWGGDRREYVQQKLGGVSLELELGRQYALRHGRYTNLVRELVKEAFTHFETEYSA
jgi:hypothetical protein